jgi:hypothetical protein
MYVEDILPPMRRKLKTQKQLPRGENDYALPYKGWAADRG